MTNFLLNWDIDNCEDLRNKKLYQQAKELMKLYGIPDSAADQVPAGFVSLSGFDTREYTKDGGKGNLKPLLQQISAQVGYETEWRLIVFFMQDVDLLHTDCETHLVEFLAHVMYYKEHDDSVLWNECHLTCEKPENIWLVTLQDNPNDRSVPSPSLSRPDETCYSPYPPNCRFLRFALDFQRENHFGRAMLELHCGVRSLARNALPSDLLRGNSTYQLKVELDEDALCDSVEQYDLWLRRIDQTLLQMDQQSPPDMLSEESAPIIDSIEESKPELHLNGLSKQEPVKELKEAAEAVLNQDGLVEKRLLQNGMERLRRWEIEQGHQVMSESAEKKCRQDMEALEQEMLNPDIRGMVNGQERAWDHMLNLIKDIGSSLKRDSAETADCADPEQKYRYAAEVKAMMERDRMKKILRVMRTMGFFFLFVLAAMAREGIRPDSEMVVWGGIVFLGLSFLVVCLTYAAYWVWYNGQRKNELQKITEQQKNRILQNRIYFNQMRKYLRLNWVLNYNELQKGEMEDQRAVLQRHKRELDQYEAVCAQLKICCAGMRGGSGMLKVRGSIQRMLNENSCAELFGIEGRLPVLSLNGNSLTGAFPFIKAIHLKKLHADGGAGVPEADHIQGE